MYCDQGARQLSEGASGTTLGTQAETRRGSEQGRAGRRRTGAGYWGAGRTARHGRAGRRWRAGWRRGTLQQARGARQVGAWQAGRATQALGARPERAAGPVGCALGALSLF